MRITFVLMCISCILNSQATIHPNLLGEELLQALRDDYKPSGLMSYAQTRDTMYLKVYRDEEGFVEGFYSGHKVELPDGINPRFHLAMDGDNNGINTEHIYPQSKGAGDGDAQRDMHHLAPARWALNTARSNYPFADIDDEETDAWFADDDSMDNIPTSNIDEYSERLNGGFGNLGEFEPREEVKGDIARSVFYFYTMYKDEADTEDPEYFMQMRDDLLQWHQADPVDSLEYIRNQKKGDFQGGKLNPFILDCTLVGRAYSNEWQDQCETSFTSSTDLVQAATEAKLYPNPVYDTINLDFEGEADKIQLFNVEGQLIQSYKMSTSIDVSRMAVGEYLLLILKKGEVKASMRFLKA